MNDIQAKLDAKDEEIKVLNAKLLEFQNADKDLSEKLQKMMADNENNNKRIQQL